MHFSNLVLLASTGAASASIFSDAASFDFSSLIKRKAACPSYWQQISKDLNAAFLDNGQCNANARAAVRYAFHDAGPYSTKLPFTAPAGGGADGSLLLNSGEMGRNENGGLEDYNTFIGNKLTSYRSQFGSTVGAADLIQFASRYVCPKR
jgi:L-ascorbate peroxidase